MKTNAMQLRGFRVLLLLSGLCLFPATDKGEQPENTDQLIHYPQEKHLVNVRQLTFGGDNAEAYFSFDNSMLVFQATNKEWDAECDQIFYSRIDSFVPKRISSNMGRTTCSYFLPGNQSIVYASTYPGGIQCPSISGKLL